MATEGTETRYYDLDGCAIVWEPGRIPRLVETGAVVYDIVRFLKSATPISKSAFDKLVAFEKLVARTRGRRPS